MRKGVWTSNSEITLRFKSARNAKGILLPDRSVRNTTKGRINRNTPARRVVSHYEVGKTTIGVIVEEILLPDIGEFTVIWRDFR